MPTDDGGEPREDAFRKVRVEGLLDEADWDELRYLGIVDVAFATTSSGTTNAIVVHQIGDRTFHPWILAERPSVESARDAVGFLLHGLAGLRRLTREKHPWSPEVREAEDNPERERDRSEAINAAMTAWIKNFDEVAGLKDEANRVVLQKAELEEERRQQAARGLPIRAARKRWNVTQAALAQQAGISRAALSEIERGVRIPDVATRAGLAQALDADEEVLFAGFKATGA